ncbi:putative short-chain dehydrogenase [Periconia macrospinosa]|uniref:Putative short-chain dehydrogenase n=1 Tax=Periconia macrospinosa TaxID=97972 RepID=A0A2V1E427_9PLEO|nr:putative short-chain dehydrogenase [Periconia macrospinosa]
MSDPLIPYAEHYLQPQGPGDARPTALQVIHDNNLSGKWTGKVVLVTGGTSGIGIETARALFATNADVFITARDLDKASRVIEDIRKSTQGDGRLEAIEMDMDKLESVKAAAQAFLVKSSKLNVLVNNAGIMGLPERNTTVDGFERQFGVNHLAHFTLTALLLPTLLKSTSPTFNSRVIMLTSSGHRYSPVQLADPGLTDNYEAWTSYGQSKTANIWTANYIDRTYGPRGVHALAVYPGAILTPLYVHVQSVPSDMPDDWQTDPAAQAFMQSCEQGASTSTWAATATALEGVGGKYLCNCGVGGPAKNLTSILDSGYAPHAFDEEGETKLWNLSCELTNVKMET